MDSTPFHELELSPELLKAIEQMGFKNASGIQSATIPALLSGKDVAGLSRTGSGKTAAFAIPAVECVDSELRAPQVVILCPTRELALQVAGEVTKLSAFKKGVRPLAVYGGAAYGPQLRGLEEGAQIVTGTPGRLIDHLERGSLRMDSVKLVVLDEADRMLDMGFRDDIDRILQRAPKSRQTAFFSATMPPEVEGLVKRFTSTPVWVRLETRAEAAPDIDQVYYEVGHGSRFAALCRILEASVLEFGIIFCSTKNAVDGVSEQLAEAGYRVDRLHGDISQAQRERVMRRFRERKIQFLIATDVAARGIDVDDVEVVLNYDLPRDPEDYIHRIGRTGRAGRSGKAISLASPREVHFLERVARLTRIRVRREKLPTAAEAHNGRVNALVEKTKELVTTGAYHANTGAIEALLALDTPPEKLLAALIHLLTQKRAVLASSSTPTARHPESHQDAEESREHHPKRPPQRKFASRREEPPFEDPARPRREPRADTFEGRNASHANSAPPRPAFRRGQNAPQKEHNPFAAPRPPRKPSFQKARPWGRKSSKNDSNTARPPHRRSNRSDS